MVSIVGEVQRPVAGRGMDTVRALLHDLRQPLAAILLMAGAEGGDDRRKLDVIAGQARWLAELVEVGLSDAANDDVASIEVAEVADRLAELAEGEPAGRVADMGGPEVRTFDSLARSYLTATGRRRLLVSVPRWGAAVRAFRAGGHLAPEHAVGKGTFEEYLNRRSGHQS